MGRDEEECKKPTLAHSEPNDPNLVGNRLLRLLPLETPFVRPIEQRLKEQKVAARLMQVHDKAQAAAGRKVGRNPTRIGRTDGLADGCRRMRRYRALLQLL